jgi:hypothetical protein
MPPKFNPYKFTTPLLIIFAAAHTYGGLFAPHDYGFHGNQVLSLMKSVHFNFNGSDCTFHGFHMGFGLMASIFQAFSAFLSWRLGMAKESEKEVLRPIAVAMFVAWIGGAVLGWMYFFVAPGVFGTAICMGLGWGAWRMYGDESVGDVEGKVKGKQN